MSLKGTHKILEETMGLPPVSAVPKRRKGRSFRNAMLAISLLLGIIAVAAVSSLTKGFDSRFFLVLPIVCLPSLFHRFVIPDRPDTKHYFQIAAMYVTVWGVLPVIYLHTINAIPDAAGYLYLAIVLLLWALGAFLPSWL